MPHNIGPIIVGPVQIGSNGPIPYIYKPIEPKQEPKNQDIPPYTVTISDDKPNWMSFAKGFIQKLKGSQ